VKGIRNDIRFKLQKWLNYDPANAKYLSNPVAVAQAILELMPKAEPILLDENNEACRVKNEE
jgi:hypothetical protein